MADVAHHFGAALVLIAMYCGAFLSWCRAVANVNSVNFRYSWCLSPST
jgi:hypothetical protein